MLAAAIRAEDSIQKSAADSAVRKMLEAMSATGLPTRHDKHDRNAENAAEMIGPRRVRRDEFHRARVAPKSGFLTFERQPSSPSLAESLPKVLIFIKDDSIKLRRTRIGF
jgi:hypothetical protein